MMMMTNDQYANHIKTKEMEKESTLAIIVSPKEGEHRKKQKHKYKIEDMKNTNTDGNTACVFLSKVKANESGHLRQKQQEEPDQQQQQKQRIMSTLRKRRLYSKSIYTCAYGDPYKYKSFWFRIPSIIISYFKMIIIYKIFY